MAPSKKMEKAKPAEAALRVTRSMSRSLVRETRSSVSPAKKLVSLSPPKRKKKTPAKAAKKKAGKKKEEEEKVEEDKTSEGVEEGADGVKSNNAEEDKTSEGVVEGADAAESNNAEEDAVVASKKIVIEHWFWLNVIQQILVDYVTSPSSIDHIIRARNSVLPNTSSSKQCNSFKTRANHVKKGLEEGVPGITVELNPEKPRRGCFEIRQDGAEIFISLLDMKRPFTKMKNLDMDEVIADIIKKIE